MILSKLKTIFKPNPHLVKPIADIEWTTRTYCCLRRAGITTVGDIVELSWNNLRSLRGGNRRICEEVERVLKGMGLKLKNE